MRERWERISGSFVNCLTEEYLEEKMPDQSDVIIYVASNIIPDHKLMKAVVQLNLGSAIFQNKKLLAFSTDKLLPYGFEQNVIKVDDEIPYTEPVVSLRYPHEIIQRNAAQLKHDITQEDFLKVLPAGVIHNGEYPLIIEEGVKIEPCYINTDDGPVYIGKDVFIMGGSQLRGPLALLEGSVVKMGAQIYGGTTIGRHCVVGGEIKNTAMMDYSNKSHGGYLGDALIGSWCNIGAGGSCSNMKNTAGEVRVWSPSSNVWIGEGTKCGVLMGDYARCAINTSFNTGTVVGIGSQVICSGLTPKYIPDFTWNAETNERYQTDKFLETADSWMRLKQKRLTEKERRVLLRLLSNH
jgi:UDP-N-acetylglucosamine diphosphorylase/glucosamine-1-phosphate N-acetyltransferase